jgi:hypothetical protein
MHSLGRERVLTLGEIKTYYDRLGSYLHAPTLDQVAAGKGATTEGKEQRCVELAGILDEVLSSPVFNVNFRVFSEISCGKCGKQIVRRLPPAPATRKDVTPLNRKPGGLMEQSNASLQRGDQG